MRILITGSAGFVGSNLPFLWRMHPTLYSLPWIICTVAEASLPSRDCVALIHRDIRNPAGSRWFGRAADLLIDCSAERSVQAEYDGNSRYLVNTKLIGIQR